MTDDELDRALFDLPLAEPPAGLRASILAATVYAPRPMLRTWETVFLGVALALFAWLVLGVSAGGSAAPILSGFAGNLVAVFTNTQVILWLSCGAAIAAVATLFDPRSSISRRS